MYTHSFTIPPFILSAVPHSSDTHLHVKDLPEGLIVGLLSPLPRQTRSTTPQLSRPVNLSCVASFRLGGGSLPAVADLEIRCAVFTTQWNQRKQVNT